MDSDIEDADMNHSIDKNTVNQQTPAGESQQFSSPIACLERVFGYHSFKPHQEQVIQSTMDGRDVLVILPTGGGKSMCYQIPALCSEGLTLVISPLIALMNDQITALQQAGVCAYALHSHVSNEEKLTIRSKMDSGELKLLYMSPEKVLSPDVMRDLTSYPVSRIAIDEAHCVSVWGNDFRPDYVQLATLREAFPSATFMALTATADRATQDDIVRQLKLQNPDRHIGSFRRKNIFIEARPGTKRIQQIEEYLGAHQNESGIVYCLSRKGTEQTSAKLQTLGYTCAHYHAGMPADKRADVQSKFQNDEIQIVCATIAFGMGIDKSNIRWIIHFNMPKNIESYYQEIGRSGRDGLPASSLLFYSWGDFMKLQRFIDESEAHETFKAVQTDKLKRMWEFALAGECRMNVVLNYFDEYHVEGCQHCDNCLHPPQKIDGLEIAQKALSAIIRCKESVGLNLLIDVLRGSKKNEIFQRRLHQIKTYGLGQDLPFLEWKAYISQLTNQGLIRVDYTDHFNLKTTPLSGQVLRGNRPIELVKFEVKAKKSDFQPKKRSKSEDFQDELYDRLKKWRLEESRKQGNPAYTIFHDSSLKELATQSPTLMSNLKDIHGFGEAKIKRYGADVLRVIRQYIDDQKHLKKVKGRTYFETLKMYKEGSSIEQIAASRGLSVSTVYRHLIVLFKNGEEVDLLKHIEEKELRMIEKEWIASSYTENTKELKEKLPDSFSYNAIHIGLTWLMHQKESASSIDK